MNRSLILLVPLALSGCVPTTYTKEVWVSKDSRGNIISRVEHEMITQPLHDSAYTVDNLKH